MLFRGFSQRRVRLLFWSALCFLGLMLDNIMIYIDLLVVPDVDLSVWRKIPGLVALAILIFGLIWDSD
jgi:hypothetical protein